MGFIIKIRALERRCSSGVSNDRSVTGELDLFESPTEQPREM